MLKLHLTWLLWRAAQWPQCLHTLLLMLLQWSEAGEFKDSLAT